MKLTAIALMTICFVSLTVFASNEDASIVTARKARDRGDVKTLQSEISNAEQKASVTKSFDDYIRLALLQNWMCEAAESSNNRKLVKAAAEAGIAAAEMAVSVNPKSSQAHQLLADLLGQLAPNVMGGGMKYGQRSTDEADTAINLDPRNAEAYVTRGISYLYTPEAFGGNKQKALEFFTKAAELDAHLDTPHIWLALFYLEAEKAGDALREINEARRLNPDRMFSQFVYEQASGNKKGTI
jgi:tetratricopeptide (TPR) repeat protein